MKVLLVDDDKELLTLLKKYFSKNGIDVRTASSGEEGLVILEKEKFDLAILDVMMPGIDGLEVLRKINQDYKYLPVIMLTAKGDEIDRVVGLEMGADDYVVKPFSTRELLARVKAIKRRDERKILEHDGTPGKAEPAETVNLDYKGRYALVRGEKIEVSSIEFDLLDILVRNKGIVLSRKRIMELVRGEDLMPNDRSIDVNISKIRQKIEKDPQNPSLIKTVWGVGYIYSGE